MRLEATGWILFTCGKGFFQLLLTACRAAPRWTSPKRLMLEGWGSAASNLFRGQLIQFASRLFSVLCQQECSPKSDYLLANKDQVKSKKEPSSCKFSRRLSCGALTPPRFRVISVGTSSSEIRPYRSLRIFWSSVKMGISE